MNRNVPLLMNNNVPRPMNRNAPQPMKLLLNKNVRLPTNSNAQPLTSRSVLLRTNKSVQPHIKQFALEEAQEEALMEEAQEEALTEEVLEEALTEDMEEAQQIDGNLQAKDDLIDGREAHSFSIKEEEVEDMAILRRNHTVVVDHMVEDIQRSHMEDHPTEDHRMEDHPMEVHHLEDHNNNVDRYHKNHVKLYLSKIADRFQSNLAITFQDKNARL